MKKNASVIIAFVLGIAITIFVSWSGDKTTATHTALSEKKVADAQVWSVRALKLKDGVDAASFEKTAAAAVSGKYGTLKGIELSVAKADRGDDTGLYIFVIAFQSKAMRNTYFPTAGGDASNDPEAQKFMTAMGKLTADFAPMIDVVPADSSYTDYVVVR